jgi:hypothetical protein
VRKRAELELRMLIDFANLETHPCMIVYYVGLVKMETLQSLFLPRIRGRCMTRVIFKRTGLLVGTIMVSF